MNDATDIDDPRLEAAVELIGRTGAQEFQIRYCEEQQPRLWIAAARWGDRWEAGAGIRPLTAVFRLCDTAVDGGTCVHCHRTTGFQPSIDPMPLDRLVCWYAWDPELKTFRRGCAGDDK